MHGEHREEREDQPVGERVIIRRGQRQHHRDIEPHRGERPPSERSHKRDFVPTRQLYMGNERPVHAHHVHVREGERHEGMLQPS